MSLAPLEKPEYIGSTLNNIRVKVQMDEEDLYSSVARGDAGYEEDSSKIDAANSATFGGADDSRMNAADEDPASSAKSAWGNAGAGVAAVKGVTR